MRTAFLAILRCEAPVWRTYQVIGGKRKAISQCLRRHGKGSRFCWQHARAEGAKP